MHQDSSQIMESILSGHQTELIEMVYYNKSGCSNRGKFNMLLAESCEPYLKAEEYLDGEDRECELKQVRGPLQLTCSP